MRVRIEQRALRQLELFNISSGAAVCQLAILHNLIKHVVRQEVFQRNK